MGFCARFIAIIQILMVEATFKIHVNGFFIEESLLGRGVRQGCPFAPLLFAMYTQPFMALLNFEALEGRIKGLTINGEKRLLHQIFANDTGIFLDNTHEATSTQWRKFTCSRGFLGLY